MAADHQAEVPGEGAHKVDEGRAEVGGPREHQALGAEEGKGKELLGQSWGCGCQIEALQELPQLQDSLLRQRNHDSFPALSLASHHTGCPLFLLLRPPHAPLGRTSLQLLHLEPLLHSAQHGVNRIKTASGQVPHLGDHCVTG